jgi:hypothetical protein
MDTVPQDDGPVERQSRLRAIPGDELSDGVVVGALATGRRRAVEHGGLGLLEVRQRQNTLGRLLATGCRSGIGDGLLSVAVQIY